MNLHEISIQDRSALEKLILSNLGALSGEIEILESGLMSEHGLVCLAVDKNRRCLLLSFSTEEDDSLLVRALGQLSWIAEHRPLLTRVFCSTGVDFEQCPKIILISPAFSKALLEAPAYLNIDVNLYRFRALKSDREQAILFEAVPPISRKPAFSFEPAPAYDRPGDSSKSVQLTEMERRFFESPAAGRQTT